jgi:phosphate transport system substrate-binding protein
MAQVNTRPSRPTAVEPPALQPVTRPIVISGEETLEPVLMMVADAFQTIQPGFKYDFQATVSGLSVKALIEGKVPIAAITRDIKPEEVAAFTTKWGYAPTRIAFAMDALVILVHQDNPVQAIKLEQLDAIWSSERRQGWPRDINTWGELGIAQYDWSNRAIKVVGHPDGSGAREIFTQQVMLGAPPKATIIRPSTIMGMVEAIEADISAIGYTSLGAVFTQTRGVAIVPIGENVGVEPTSGNVANGTYPLSRSVSFYINKPQGAPLDPRVAAFLRYLLSPEGQKGVTLNGFASLDPGVIVANLRRIDGWASK